MKLIFCPKCKDVIRLFGWLRHCGCLKSWGRYTDELNAEIGGEAIPIGFVNSEFFDALAHQPDIGLGERFTAFVIPKVCPTVNVKDK